MFLSGCEIHEKNHTTVEPRLTGYIDQHYFVHTVKQGSIVFKLQLNFLIINILVVVIKTPYSKV